MQEVVEIFSKKVVNCCFTFKNKPLTNHKNPYSFIMNGEKELLVSVVNENGTLIVSTDAKTNKNWKLILRNIFTDTCKDTAIENSKQGVVVTPNTSSATFKINL
ncbi:hypothetical protein [Lederbergia citri]|uniref:Uncharacterized protein n=1 Tax=Lederbergia citri TaxID=2833580 RepID=A0A942TIV5_9BACI|nr:hypothetical protein [Lederbergia citri]MBS4197427.1 hypothetical protein [Lederbergia citri]